MTKRGEKLFLGPRIKRLRTDLGLSQARLAAELGVSASYVNLIERNQRPVSATLLVALADRYDLDLASLRGGSDAKLVADLHDALRDPALAGGRIGRAEAEDVVNASPAIASAFLALHAKYRQVALQVYSDEAPLADRSKVELIEDSSASLNAVRDLMTRNRNHFPDLEAPAEALAEELWRQDGLPDGALVARLAEEHRLTVKVRPAELMSTTLRVFDRHRLGLDLSELLTPAGPRFQMAFHIGLLEQREVIDDLVEAAGLPDAYAVGLARVSLASYFAGALLMPYARFLADCERTRYDVDLLGQRYGTSFDQTAHRLTTLHRPEARGVPFFYVRIDKAGNVSKRFSPGKFHLSKFGGACPLWNVHDSFEQPERVLTQIIEMPDGARYFSIAKTVQRLAGTYAQPAVTNAVALGCDIAYAPRLVYAQDYDLEEAAPVPVGVNCYLCERPDCASRAHPPLNRQLTFDERARGISLYKFRD